MRSAIAKLYVNTAVNPNISQATYWGQVPIVFPEIRNFSSWTSNVTTSAKNLMNANGTMTSLYTTLTGISDIALCCFLVQYNNQGTMTPIDNLRNHFTMYALTATQNYKTLIYDFGGDYYYVDCVSGTISQRGLFSKLTKTQLVNPSAGLYCGSFQYNTSLNNLSLSQLFYYNNRLYRIGFDFSSNVFRIQRESSDIGEVLSNYFLGNVTSDPYSGGGTSTSGGGHGDFDTMTDSMSEPSYDPVESYNRGYANHGFAKVYLPTSAQLLSLHNYLWSSSLDNTLKKMYASPIDCIISLNMIPLDLSSILGDPVNQQNIVIGNVDTQIENVNVPYTQFIMLDCGTISISEFFGSYLDYSPYTKLSIYLPYIGMKELDIDDFMNGEIGVKYYIDIVSGDCVAYINQVNLSSNDVRPAIAGGAGVLYQFTGNVAFNVPISAQNFSQIYAASAGAMIGGAGLLASALSGGLSAPMALTGIAATGVNVATSKPTISRGGSIPSTSGYLGIQVPYLILTRPRQCLPEDQNALVGYPAYITVTIEDIEGYNEFEIVHLENIPATDAEKAEIEKLLKSGVIL